MLRDILHASCFFIVGGWKKKDALSVPSTPGPMKMIINGSAHMSQSCVQRCRSHKPLSLREDVLTDDVNALERSGTTHTARGLEGA